MAHRTMAKVRFGTDSIELDMWHGVADVWIDVSSGDMDRNGFALDTSGRICKDLEDECFE